ncbi:preprotein translocase subunit SecG [Mucilaginibacter sp.]|uniref:preprotein translocase subunit SecG n=1 Tax=Mucilaginibacter sp. TaxID=1882438 RepID=UPI00284A986D|nr:preprotein translocase subunit SecG [Mucilaginibacter sp.]MDR3694526.1 preprotein translocase subunit SecG [Mucilaginibacter sp.]
MYQLLLIIAIIVCVLLVLIVLIQNPKGGGLSSNFSSSSQLMGVQKTGDFLEKGTWGLAIMLMVLAMTINVLVKGGTQTTTDKFKEQKEGASKPVTPAANPVSFPGAQQPANTQPATSQPAPAQKK